MFAKLTGKIDTLMTDSLILDVNGVGYHVYASGRTLGLIGGTGDPVSLMIDTHVREDHIHLYGFSSVLERDWFRLLTGVQGVGARSALAILTVCPAENLSVVIASGDVAALRRAEGVGPKLATRIATELKDKVQSITLGASAIAGFVTPESPAKKSKAAPQAAPENPAPDQDVVSALVNLGYGRSEAFSAVMKARQSADGAGDLGFDRMFKSALKELAA